MGIDMWSGPSLAIKSNFSGKLKTQTKEPYFFLVVLETKSRAMNVKTFQLTSHTLFKNDFLSTNSCEASLTQSGKRDKSAFTIIELAAV